jgi:ABC-type multidrug transport system fused ATPase/permease subunit
MIDYPDRFPRKEGLDIPDKSNWPPKIEFCNVSYKFEDAQEMTLKNINLTINPGENIALVGHNGAGKTTLVKLLCGLYHPTEGKILIAGHAIDEYNLEEYHTLLSTIFQDPYTLPLSIAANIACVSEELTDYNKVRDCLKKSGLFRDVDKLKEKERTYISQTFREDGVELSGGMQQKLMLARAMYKDAPILVLDEPTAALDPIAESSMYEEYDKISKNKSSIFISHRLASTKFCDRIIYLENGQILESGTHEELMNMNGRYAGIFQVQSQYYKNEEDTYENTLCSGC